MRWRATRRRSETAVLREMDRPNGERERPAASAPSDDTILATAAAKTGKRAWDVSALLGEEQRAAVAELAELLLHRPLARPEWNTSHMDGVGDEAPDGDDSAGGAEEASIAALYRKLGEEQEATEDLGDDDLTDVHEHHARMTGIVQLCDDILKLLAVVEDTLVRLQTQHDSVVDKTSALHAECETLLADKLELEALASRIEGHLSVYDQLEGMQRQLAAPDFGVTSQAFMPLLVQADEAIAHLSKSAQFADSSAYLSRFRQVQARLLALVQAHVTGLLQSMTDKILLNTKAAAPTAGRTGGNGDKAAVTSGAGASDESGSGETGRGAAIEMSMAYVQFQSVGDAVKETLGMCPRPECMVQSFCLQVQTLSVRCWRALQALRMHQAAQAAGLVAQRLALRVVPSCARALPVFEDVVLTHALWQARWLTGSWWGRSMPLFCTSAATRTSSSDARCCSTRCVIASRLPRPRARTISAPLPDRAVRSSATFVTANTSCSSGFSRRERSPNTRGSTR